MAFYFKMYPEIIKDGRLYIAEPPLYRVADKKNPFVINKEDYVDRYVKAASKDYKVGISTDKDIEYLDKQQLVEFLSSTKSFVDDLSHLADHYKLNERLLEMIIEEFAKYDTGNTTSKEILRMINRNINDLATRISSEFPEIYFDPADGQFKGVADKKHQLFELTESSIDKSKELSNLIKRWEGDSELQLMNIKTGTVTSSRLLGILKVLRKYQPDILHRFKGLKLVEATYLKCGKFLIA